jgi:mannose-1-phosphate guanylyltransferase/mannose-6-phosphate isomerase
MTERHKYQSPDVRLLNLSGSAKVGNGEKKIVINTNVSTYIPAGHKRRLQNLGFDIVVMIEVQTGMYLGEDDIVRFQDLYGRI